jgi:hypothetical protein
LWENLCSGLLGDRQGLDWEFVVIQKNEPNAMVLPGGKVVVYTGILRLLDNDDELAGVLAHEVAHVLARHAVRSLPPSLPPSSLLYSCAALTLMTSVHTPSLVIEGRLGSRTISASLIRRRAHHPNFFFCCFFFCPPPSLSLCVCVCARASVRACGTLALVLQLILCSHY